MTQSKRIVRDLPPSPGSAPTPLWLWPHLLSLDAPLVAVGWQAWWGYAQGVRLQPFHHAILGLGVWMIYLADRLADGLRASPAEWGTQRHAFYRRHRRLGATLLAGAVISLVLLAPRCLSAPDFWGGMTLLGVAAGYFWLIHLRARWPIKAPKEAAVGVLFSVGVSYFVARAGGGVTPTLAVRSLFFAGLCFLNCALITRWERTLRDRRDPTSLLNAHPLLTGRLGACAAGLAAAALAAGTALGDAGAFAPLALSAGGLWALDQARRRLPADALRVLADAVLLTPWIFWWLR